MTAREKYRWRYLNYQAAKVGTFISMILCGIWILSTPPTKELIAPVAFFIIVGAMHAAVVYFRNWWLGRPIYLRCPACDMHVDWRERWECGHCNHDHGRMHKGFQYNILTKCEHCNATSGSVMCPHCGEDFALDESGDLSHPSRLFEADESHAAMIRERRENKAKLAAAESTEPELEIVEEDEGHEAIRMMAKKLQSQEAVMRWKKEKAGAIRASDLPAAEQKDLLQFLDLECEDQIERIKMTR